VVDPGHDSEQHNLTKPLPQPFAKRSFRCACMYKLCYMDANPCNMHGNAARHWPEEYRASPAGSGGALTSSGIEQLIAMTSELVGMRIQGSFMYLDVATCSSAELKGVSYSVLAHSSPATLHAVLPSTRLVGRHPPQMGGGLLQRSTTDVGTLTGSSLAGEGEPQPGACASDALRPHTPAYDNHT